MVVVAQVMTRFSDRWLIVTRQGREWNRMAKESIIDVLRDHHKRRIPGHFIPSAHGKYGYVSRSPITRKRKERRGLNPNLDLIKFGRVKTVVFGNNDISVRGTYSGGVMVATLKMGKFPFPVAKANTKRGIRPAQMQKEIATVSSGEASEMVKMYRDGIRRRLMARRSMQLSRGIYRR